METETKKKETRRGRRGKINTFNEIENLNYLYVNIRGILSKLTCLNSIINTIEPHFILLNETHLEDEQKPPIKGYMSYVNNRKKMRKVAFVSLSKTS